MARNLEGYRNRGRGHSYARRGPLTEAQREAMEDLGFFMPAPVIVGATVAPSDWSDPQRLRAAVEAQFREAQRLRKKKAA